MTNIDTQALVDRLARRLAVARLTLEQPTFPAAIAIQMGYVADIADQVAALPAGTALPPVRRVFGPATERLLASMGGDTIVPDTVPADWTRQRCAACGQVPDVLARCRCS